MDSSKIDTLKKLIREESVPYFSDGELEFYLSRNSGDLNAAAYECLCIKAENNTLNISGLNLSDTSKYFRSLAQKYRPRHSGVLKG